VEKGGWVYMITNKRNTVIYTGVAAVLAERVQQHKDHDYKKAFTAKYQLHKLVYFEKHSDIETAIEREKQIKGGSRKRKEDLIISINPKWRGLFEYILGNE
jgi:putative endonuclease